MTRSNRTSSLAEAAVTAVRVLAAFTACLALGAGCGGSGLLRAGTGGGGGNYGGTGGQGFGGSIPGTGGAVPALGTGGMTSPAHWQFASVALQSQVDVLFMIDNSQS